MLHVAAPQMAQLRQQARAQFEQEMVEHLTPRSPLHVAALGPDGLRPVVSFGIDRAAAHGYRLRGSVRLWLELMLWFGGLFDESPLVPPRVRPLLTCTDPDREMLLAQALHAESAGWLKAVAGPGNTHSRQAMARVHGLLQDGWQPAAGDLKEQLLQMMAWVHPAQLARLGPEPHRQLIDAALADGRTKGAATPRGLTLFAVLALVAGHGVTRDPLYPWVSRTLGDRALGDPAARVARLERRATTYLQRVVTNLGIV